MAKTRTLFTCRECGNESPKWLGRCPECGAWNSFVEGVRAATAPRTSSGGGGRSLEATLATPERMSAVSLREVARVPSALTEFDRVLGGGTVPGSLVLIGGDPGIGKSTLLLQVAANVAGSVGPVLYVSGEESARQVRLRAERLGAVSENLFVLAETNLDAVVGHVEQLAPVLVIVDSIQTVFLEGVPSSPGNVSQLRECTLRLMGLAKTRHVPIFLVGHVTKEGNIAGPRALEHIVDCVLYLEGERFYSYRLLRAAKNRFGSTNEVGVFEMEQDGMRQVTNPSAAFLSERVRSAPGSAVTVPLEGTRALLVEVQALTSSAGIGLARRTAIGVDQNRLQLLVAVLSKRMGLPLSTQDIYVNVVAGLKLGEPAADLGVALAIGSSYCDAPVDPGLIVMGEVGLLGELRPVAQLERRLAEAGRLGFERCILPAGDLRRLSGRDGVTDVQRDGLTVAGAGSVGEALTMALGQEAIARSRRRRAPDEEREGLPRGAARFAGARGGRGDDDLGGAEFDDSIFDGAVE